MAQYRIERGKRQRNPRAMRITLLVAIVIILIGARSFASWAIEYAWWKELGQLGTWFAMITYGVLPVAAATVVAFAILWLAHARALKFAGTGPGEHRMYARITTLALLVLGYLIAAATIETWTVVRYAGSRGLPAAATAWRDSVFGLPLGFYLFDLPFYGVLRSYLLALLILAVLVYWVAARGWQLRYRLPDLRNVQELDASFFKLEGGLESRFLRGAAVVFLLAMALRFFLARYEMVYNDHGFMVGVDYVDYHVALPLQWLLVAACVAAAALLWMGRWLAAAAMAVALLIQFAVPRIVAAVYVRPNEISLERSLHRHPHSRDA